MINPLTHARNAAEVETYKVEPYVVAADVYTADGQRGRGGWTWYTGSASWLYRVGLETILGLMKTGDTLRETPAVPRVWPGYSIEYRCGDSTYVIDVRRANGESERGRVVVDGAERPDGMIPLVDDGRRHEVLVQYHAGE